MAEARDGPPCARLHAQALSDAACFASTWACSAARLRVPARRAQSRVAPMTLTVRASRHVWRRHISVSTASPRLAAASLVSLTTEYRKFCAREEGTKGRRTRAEKLQRLGAS
jgi:hypothetical protein